ncbi:MAG: serine/threonine protein kinase [Polyangiaceae bacterium]|nr:serine/threonine protein kinase [Polyangiaceae bacterium]
MPEIGDVIGGRYRVLARLGAGGMGEVWAAEDAETGAPVAVKMLNPAFAAMARPRMRFLREAGVARAVSHPGIAQVFDVGEHDGAVFVAFERLHGASLATVLRAETRLPLRTFVALMVRLAEVLVETHRAGIVHRDLKPGNLFIHRSVSSDELELKLIDFGVSKLATAVDGLHTQTGSFLGSPRYVSPEHVVAPASVDARSDLWATGVILFEGTTGGYPHRAPDPARALLAIVHQPPIAIDSVRPDLSPGLRSIIRDCLKPKLSRLGSAVELRDRLVDVLRAEDPSLDQTLPPREPERGVSEMTDSLIPETVESLTGARAFSV